MVPLFLLLLCVPLGVDAGKMVLRMNSESLSAISILYIVQAALFIAVLYFCEEVGKYCAGNRDFREVWKWCVPALYLAATAYPYLLMPVTREPLRVFGLCLDVVCSVLFLLILHKLGKNAGGKILPGERDKP